MVPFPGGLDVILSDAIRYWLDPSKQHECTRISAEVEFALIKTAGSVDFISEASYGENIFGRASKVGTAGKFGICGTGGRGGKCSAQRKKVVMP
jgi:hypothetical protein